MTSDSGKGESGPGHSGSAGHFFRLFFRDAVGGVDPLSALEAADAPHRLDHIIHAQGEDGQPSRPAQQQAAHAAQRDGHQPHEQDVGLHQELGIAAAAQDAFGHDGLDTLEEDDHRVGTHHLFGHKDGLVVQGVHGDGQRAAGQHHHGGDQAEEDAQYIERIPLLHGLLAGAFAQRMAGNDAGRVGDALDHHGEQAVDDLTDGVCGHHRGTHVAEDDADDVAAQTQQAVTDQHRQAEAEIVGEELLAGHVQQVFDPQTQLLVLEEDVTEGDEELRRAGQQGAQCGTGDLHPGSTEFAEDEGIVGDQVDHKGHTTDDQAKLRLPDRTHQLGSHKAGAVDDKDKGRDPQVPHALFHDMSL